MSDTKSGSPIKLGVVGPGLIWDNAHRDVLLSLTSSFEVAGFLARSDITLSKAHAQVPSATLYHDYDAFLAAPEIEAVVLLTPIPQNAPMTVRALEAGKTVFVEKPFAVSVAEGDTVLDASSRAGTPVYVLEQAPYAQLWNRVGEIIRAGRVGTPATYEKVRHVFLDPHEDQSGGYGKTDWRIDTTFPIGNFFDGGVHDLAVHAKLFGSPAQLRAWGNNFRPGFGEFDHVSTLFRYESGLTGFFSHSAFLGGRRNYFTIRGTEGLIHIDETGPFLESKRGTRENIPTDPESPHEQMWRALADAAAAGAPAPYTLEHAARDLSLLEHIGASLHRNAEVDVT
ncbi:MAG: Gfo/Idh/MocA family oxidoreductase [Spirochaetia bacterium]